MKRNRSIIPLLCMSLFLAGCSADVPEALPSTEPVTETTAVTKQDVPESAPPTETTADAAHISNETYSTGALCEMALDYYEALTGYRPPHISAETMEDGMVLIHLYDDMGTHIVTSDWYTVDPMSAVGTNVIMETIDLKSPPEAVLEMMDILVGICMVDGESEDLALDTAKYMMIKAQELSGTVFGEITSEEDAIAKARTILTEIGASDFIEDAESDYVEINGELVKYERDGPSWHVEYFPEYDAWRVTPALPSGVTEDGRKVGAPGMPPYVIMRGEDGMVMGVFY